jgi:hypothetical protein
MNTKLHAVTDGHPIRFFMTAGQVSDYTGAAALLGSLPKAEWLLADRGYEVLSVECEPVSRYPNPRFRSDSENAAPLGESGGAGVLVGVAVL